MFLLIVATRHPSFASTLPLTPSLPPLLISSRVQLVFFRASLTPFIPSLTCLKISFWPSIFSMIFWCLPSTSWWSRRWRLWRSFNTSANFSNPRPKAIRFCPKSSEMFGGGLFGLEPIHHLLPFNWRTSAVEAFVTAHCAFEESQILSSDFGQGAWGTAQEREINMAKWLKELQSAPVGVTPTTPAEPTFASAPSAPSAPSMAPSMDTSRFIPPYGFPPSMPPMEWLHHLLI